MHVFLSLYYIYVKLFMNYKQTINFLYQNLPMYQNIGQHAYKSDLSNIIKLCALLGNPQDNLRFIHIGGTNGKGSVSHICASIFQEAKYKTGLYTSPHLFDFRERIRVNGKCIEKKCVVEFITTYKQAITEINPSFFEITVALALYYFKKSQVDVAIIEVGLGGRLDSTNIITPLLSCITNIGLDHTNILGDTKEKIAKEKAGIIKKDTPIIIGESDANTNAIFLDEAKRNASSLIFADKTYSIKPKDETKWYENFSLTKNKNIDICNLKSALIGNYQQKNICTIYAIIQESLTFFPNINHKAIRNGLKNVIKNTHFRGRWEKIQHKPLVVTDTAHNAHGVQETIKQLFSLPIADIHIVWGMVSDKDIESIISILPIQAHYYLCSPNIARAMPVEQLQTYFGSHNYSCYKDVKSAYSAAYEKCTKEGGIYVGGSTFVVADFLSKKK